MVDPSGFAGQPVKYDFPPTLVEAARPPGAGAPAETASAPRSRMEEAAERMHQISERAIEFGQGILDAHEVELREHSWSLAASFLPFAAAHRAREVAPALAASYKQGGFLEVFDLVNPLAGALRLYVDGETAVHNDDYRKLGRTSFHVAVIVSGMLAGGKGGGRGAPSRINVTRDGFLHTLRRHLDPGRLNKSQFSMGPAALRDLLQSPQVVGAEMRALGPGRYIREVVMEQEVGQLPLNRTGASTNILSVVTDGLGNLESAFPGLLSDL